jgi:hypothetical protein
LSVLKKTTTTINHGKNNLALPFSFLHLDAHMDSAFLASPAYAQLSQFCKWSSEKCYEWLNTNGFEAYFPQQSDGSFINKWIKSGLHLLQATQSDYEKELGIKNIFHRKRLVLLLKSLFNSDPLEISYEENFKFIDAHWVTKWLDDIGLPQYKDIFNESMIDGRMLNALTSEEMHMLNVTSELHFLSVKQAIHVLRLNKFDAQCLRRRGTGDDLLDKAEVVQWTNHRVMEWLRSIDLSEYAPNLRGSGVHGGLMTYENRFNSTVLADILSIPSTKTLLRRHLNTLFIDLIGIHMQHLKKEAESKPGFVLLNATSKVKHAKPNKGISVFGRGAGNVASNRDHKRTKSQDGSSRDFFSVGSSAVVLSGGVGGQCTYQSASFKSGAQSRLANINTQFNNTNVYSSTTLPSNTTDHSSQQNGLSMFKAKMSIMPQECQPPTSNV